MATCAWKAKIISCVTATSSSSGSMCRNRLPPPYPLPRTGRGAFLVRRKRQKSPPTMWEGLGQHTLTVTSPLADRRRSDRRPWLERSQHMLPDRSVALEKCGNWRIASKHNADLYAVSNEFSGYAVRAGRSRVLDWGRSWLKVGVYLAAWQARPNCDRSTCLTGDSFRCHQFRRNVYPDYLILSSENITPHSGNGATRANVWLNDLIEIGREVNLKAIGRVSIRHVLNAIHGMGRSRR